MQKNDRIVKLIFEHVNLTGYGRSAGWLGYTERKTSFTMGIADNIIDVFLTHFLGPSMYLVSSYVKVSGKAIDDNLVLSRKLERTENELLQKHYLKEVFDEESQEEFSPSILRPCFNVVEDPTNDLIRKFSYLAFADSRIDGHCFFLSDLLGIIAYPHEDTGFGFIRFRNSKSGTLTFREFMNEVSASKQFSVFVNKK